MISSSSSSSSASSSSLRLVKMPEMPSVSLVVDLVSPSRRREQPALFDRLFGLGSGGGFRLRFRQGDDRFGLGSGSPAPARETGSGFLPFLLSRRLPELSCLTSRPARV